MLSRSFPNGECIEYILTFRSTFRYEKCNSKCVSLKNISLQLTHCMSSYIFSMIEVF